MRNPVAHSVVQNVPAPRAIVARVVTLTVLPAILLIATAYSAAAAPLAATEADARLSGVAGPVGIIAVILGLGGLIAGLLRRRRTAAIRALAQPPAVTPEPARTSSVS